MHRAYPADEPAIAEAEANPYIPQRGSYGMRVRGGMPRSLGGRILLGGGAFAVLAASVLTVAGVHRFLLHDERFLISSSSAISIQGNEHISRAEVLGVFGSDLERNIFKVPLGERRADLERLPWVAHAAVMRLLPNHLRVQIAERTPVAFTRQGTQIGLVDADGVLLDMPPQSAGDPHYSFPVLTGLAPDDLPETRATRMEVYRRFMADLASGGPKVTQSLSEVDVTNPEDVKALITTGGSDILVHFGDEAFLQRYREFEQHLPEWRAQYPRLASADMRYERQVVLEMQGGTPPPQTGSPTASTAVDAHTPAVPARKALPASANRSAAASARAASATPLRHAVMARPAAHTTANQRVFAALRAAHRAQQGKAKAVR